MSEEALEQQSFRLAIGQAKTIEFALDSTPETSVSGWSMAFYIRSRSGALLITKTSGGGVTCTDGDAGVWEVRLADDDSTGLKSGLLNWSLWRTDDGSETPLAIGTCQVYRTSRTG